jgi:hypothetical protein
MPRPENFDPDDWNKYRYELVWGTCHNFVGDCDQLRLSRPDSAARPPIIYHYTDVGGAHAMITAKTLRLSERTHLNDPVEIEYGYNLAQRCTEHFARRDKRFAEVCKELRAYFHQHVDARYHMACFSRLQDNLPQWRTYADDGRGVCLGFDSNVTPEPPTWPGATVYIRGPFLMSYDTRELIRAHHEVLHLAVKTLNRAQEPYTTKFGTLGDVVIDAFDEREMRSLVRAITDGLADHFLETSHQYKHRGYEFEQEWRIVVRVEKKEKHLSGKGQHTRVRSGEIVHYIDLPLQPGYETSLKSVMVGPSAPVALVSQLQRLLDAQGYADVSVTKSRIPYRSVRSSS